MADIFISYSKKDRSLARDLTSSLESVGYTVWWDTNLLSGDTFTHVINRELRESRAVIVIWTLNSVTSEWVIAEASRGRGAQKLLPVMIDGLSEEHIPVPFNVLHTEPLSNQHAIYGALDALGVVPSLEDKPGAVASPAPAVRPEPPPPPPVPDAPIEPPRVRPAPPPDRRREQRAPAPEARPRPSAAPPGRVTYADDERWSRLWRGNRSLALATVGLWAIAGLLVPVLGRGLNTLSLFGVPLGYLLNFHVTIVVFVLVAAWFSWRKEALDAAAGADRSPA
jgi:putative solute:sodium symporter small subunit